MATVDDLVAPGTGLLELEAFLPYRLAVLSSLTARALAGIHEPHGLNKTEWMVLTTIAAAPQTTAKQIGSVFHMQKAKVSRAIAGLLEHRLISRRPHPRDHRLVLLELTPRGQELYAACAPAAADVGRRLDNTLADADRKALLRSLHRLGQAAQRLAAEPAATSGASHG